MLFPWLAFPAQSEPFAAVAPAGAGQPRGRVPQRQLPAGEGALAVRLASASPRQRRLTSPEGAAFAAARRLVHPPACFAASPRFAEVAA